MEPPGLKYSSFARISTLLLGFMPERLTRGVPPMVSRMVRDFVIFYALDFLLNNKDE